MTIKNFWYFIFHINQANHHVIVWAKDVPNRPYNSLWPMNRMCGICHLPVCKDIGWMKVKGIVMNVHLCCFWRKQLHG